MFEFLKTKRSRGAVTDNPETNAAAPINTQQHNDIRRELIRVVLKDTLRAHGIPMHWLACEVIIITRPNKVHEVHVHLVIVKWNEKLLRYAHAFERELLLGLDRFDPAIDHSDYIVSWRFAPECECPFDELPSPNAWLSSGKTQSPDEPVPVLDRRRVPREPHSPPPGATNQKKGKAPKEYAPTQIAPLR